jgi:hypothetical protein
MEQDPSEQVFRAGDLAPAVREHKTSPEALPPLKTISEALDAAAALVVVVDRGEEFILLVFLVIIQATINLDTGYAKGIIQIRARKSITEAF